MAYAIKFDDGSGGFASNCFPVRSLIKQADEGKDQKLLTRKLLPFFLEDSMLSDS